MKRNDHNSFFLVKFCLTLLVVVVQVLGAVNETDLNLNMQTESITEKITNDTVFQVESTAFSKSTDRLGLNFTDKSMDVDTDGQEMTSVSVTRPNMTYLNVTEPEMTSVNISVPDMASESADGPSQTSLILDRLTASLTIAGVIANSVSFITLMKSPKGKPKLNIYI